MDDREVRIYENTQHLNETLEEAGIELDEFVIAFNRALVEELEDMLDTFSDLSIDEILDQIEIDRDNDATS